MTDFIVDEIEILGPEFYYYEVEDGVLKQHVKIDHLFTVANLVFGPTRWSHKVERVGTRDLPSKSGVYTIEATHRCTVTALGNSHSEDGIYIATGKNYGDVANKAHASAREKAIAAAFASFGHIFGLGSYDQEIMDHVNAQDLPARIPFDQLRYFHHPLYDYNTTRIRPTSNMPAIPSQPMVNQPGISIAGTPQARIVIAGSPPPIHAIAGSSHSMVTETSPSTVDVGESSGSHSHAAVTGKSRVIPAPGGSKRSRETYSGEVLQDKLTAAMATVESQVTASKSSITMKNKTAAASTSSITTRSKSATASASSSTKPRKSKKIKATKPNQSVQSAPVPDINPPKTSKSPPQSDDDFQPMEKVLRNPETRKGMNPILVDYILNRIQKDTHQQGESSKKRS